MEEDDLRLKMTFGGRPPSVEYNLRRTLHAAYSALWHFSSKIDSFVSILIFSVWFSEFVSWESFL